MKSNQKFVGWLLMVGLLLALSVAVSFWAFRQIEDSAQARKYGFIEIQSAYDLLAKLSDAETGQRGYTLTGDESFLQPYLVVRDSISANLQDLRRLSLVRESHRHLDAVVPLVNAKLGEMADVIVLRRNQGAAAALALVQTV